MDRISALTLLVLWCFTWRRGMLDSYHDWRYMRAQKKRLAEINVLEDLLKER